MPSRGPQRELSARRPRKSEGWYVDTRLSDDAESRASMSNASYRKTLNRLSLSRLACEQADHFEMRRLAFATEAVAADDFKPGRRGKAIQLGGGKAEVAMVERFHHRAVIVPAQRDGKQPAATAQ